MTSVKLTGSAIRIFVTCPLDDVGQGLVEHQSQLFGDLFWE